MANGKIYTKSVFAKYFDSDDPAVIAWANNVLDKLITKGLVAEFILREDKDGNETDFEDLFKPLCLFFSYLVQLARQFELFTDDIFLIEQYLQQHGQFTCGDETLDQFVYLIQNALRVRAQRGTIKMIEISTDDAIPHGEVLRLICWDTLIFFKLGVARPERNSWNVDHCGPAFRGCTGRYDLNIGYEYTEGVEDLSKYPLINEDSVFLTVYRGKDCLKIEDNLDDVAGIGADEPNKRIVVDPRFNFEITFYVAQDINLSNITFGCLAFDSNGDQISLQNIVDNSDSNYFFQTRKLNKSGRFYFVRGILFNKDKDLVSSNDARLNIGFGHNLKMTESVTSIIPYIVLDNNIGNDSDDIGDNDSDHTDLLGTPDTWFDMGIPMFAKSSSLFSFNTTGGTINLSSWTNHDIGNTDWTTGASPSVATNSDYLIVPFHAIAGQSYGFSYSLSNVHTSGGASNWIIGFLDDSFNDVGGSQFVSFSTTTGASGSKIVTPISNGSYVYMKFSNAGVLPVNTITVNSLAYSSSYTVRAYQLLNVDPYTNLQFDVNYAVGTLGVPINVVCSLMDDDNNILASNAFVISVTGPGSQTISVTASSRAARVLISLVLAPTFNYALAFSIDNEFLDDGGSSSTGSYDGSPSLFLWNLKVTPCALKYERCYLNNKNFIDIIMDNKNGRYSDVQIDNILRKYFIPYNSAFKTTHLNDLGEIIPDVSLMLLESGDYILLEDSNTIELE